jgi:ZIP family zinc transporter
VAQDSVGVQIAALPAAPSLREDLGTPPVRSGHLALWGPSLAVLIATGIGLHNFSEGLAIGQTASAGLLRLAWVLVVGFALHNATEGLGIVAPLAGTSQVSWRFLTVLGLLGGGPTLVGTVIGSFFVSTALSVLFLSLAAGAIIFIIGELFHVARRLGAPSAVSAGLFGGFALGFLTDLLMTLGGA